MKKKAPEKTELEKRLEEEVAREQLAAQSDQGLPPEQDSEESQDLNEYPDIGVLEEPEPLPEIDVEAVLRERDALNERLLRAHAEFDNYRKRVARDHERMRKTAAESLMRDLLPVVDNLERALDHRDTNSESFAEGIEMVLRQFGDVLRAHGLEPIPAVGQPFDPHVHEAVMQVESSEVPGGHVVQEIQKGYRLGTHILRPGKVSVSKETSEASENEAET